MLSLLLRQQLKPQKLITKDGKEYPLFRVEISSASHPFYTGTEKVIDTAGRVDRFKRRAAASSAASTSAKK